jgi:type III secretory pathway component EscU
MEPISALALAYNNLELIDRAFKYAAIIKEIRDSETGLKEKHRKLISDTDGLSAIADELRHVQHEVSRALADARMGEVAMQCNSICATIQTIAKNVDRKERGLFFLLPVPLFASCCISQI